jgi:ribonuclease P protein component
MPTSTTIDSKIKGPKKVRFEEIYQSGIRFRSKSLTLIKIEGNGLIGIATSKKIGDKPDRNYQKRRVKSILQTYRRTSTYDLIFVASVKTKDLKYETLRSDLAQLIREAGIDWTLTVGNDNLGEGQ